MNLRAAKACTLSFIAIGGFLLTVAWGQKFAGFDRDAAQDLLRQVADDVKKHYYDPKFHGLDWDGKVRETKQKIDQAENWTAAVSEIAALLDLLDDSHTYLVPPPHSYHHDYGWTAGMIGDACYVTHVRPGSDAESKGVKPGDQVMGMNGYAMTRKNFFKVEYFFETLRPQQSLRLVLRDATGKERTIEVVTKVTQIDYVKNQFHSLGGRDAGDAVRQQDEMKRRIHYRTTEIGNDLMILKLPVFFLRDVEIDSMMGKARKHKTLILDLRDNAGGDAEVLKKLLSRMFANNIKVVDRVRRNGPAVVEAKAYGGRFEGKVIVLVDSRSASAAEVFARVMQLEKRGVVLGDVSSGRVMEAVFYADSAPGAAALYGAFITDADLIMSDGKSLEGKGVTPDEVILLTPADLAAGRDPVLARAAELAGVKLSPEDAGKLFPYEWPVDWSK